jgi:hypothetical protein
MIDILGHLNSSELNGLILLGFFRSSRLLGRLDERLLLRRRLPPCGRHMDAIWSARALSSPDRDRCQSTPAGSNTAKESIESASTIPFVVTMALA